MSRHTKCAAHRGLICIDIHVITSLWFHHVQHWKYQSIDETMMTIPSSNSFLFSTKSFYAELALLTCLIRVTQRPVRELLDYRWFIKWSVAYSTPLLEPMLPCIRKHNHVKFSTKIHKGFMHANKFKNVVNIVAAIVSRFRCVKPGHVLLIAINIFMSLPALE